MSQKPVVATEKEDKSVCKTLRTALLELLAEKPYVDISVTDIVNRAGVARISYYRHFSSVNDIVNSIVDELTERLIDNVYTLVNSKDKEKWIIALTDFFEFTGEKGNKYFKNITDSNMAVIFVRVAERLKNVKYDPPCENANDKYNLVGKLGLIESIARSWIINGMQEDPQDMAKYIAEIIVLF